jgi:hypothetical protein
MTPDPTREWYVYFREQEMGPFTERELQKKISLGELDESAFVFTEGLSDWTSVDDVEFLSPSKNSETALENSERLEGVQETQLPESTSSFAASSETLFQTVSPRALSVEKLGAEEKSFSMGSEDSVSDLEKRLDAAKVKPEGHRKRMILKWGLAACVTLFAIAIGIDFMNMAPTMKMPFGTRLFGTQSPKEPENPKNPENFENKVASSADTATQTAAPSMGSHELMWNELNQLRVTRDRQSPPFRISSVLLSPDRPVILGAVSSLIDASRIHLVVYPDLSRSLMADPIVWWFDPVLVDGYFSIGPLNVNGKPLPPGTYNVMVQGMGKFLGMVSFDVGAYPSGPDLEVQLKGLQAQRALAAAEEQKYLERLFSEFDALYENLRQESIRSAIKGSSHRVAWTKSMRAWMDAFVKTSNELSQMRGVSYFKNLQDKMYVFSKEMLRVQGLMELYNKEGRAAFEKRAASRYSEVWNAIQKDRDFLKSDVLALSSQTVFEPVIDQEILKTRLLERK